MTSQPWSDFLKLARPRVEWAEAGVIICLDPGETTGWAMFYEGELWAHGQEATPQPSDIAGLIKALVMLPALSKVHTIVYEEYRIRGNKAREHIGSEVVTIQHIGAIKVVADELGLKLVKQSAGMAKEFATDTKLRRWGLYQTNMRHSNDAIRHGCRWLLFNFGRQRP